MAPGFLGGADKLLEVLLVQPRFFIWSKMLLIISALNTGWNLTKLSIDNKSLHELALTKAVSTRSFGSSFML